MEGIVTQPKPKQHLRENQHSPERPWVDYSPKALWLRAVVLRGHEGLTSVALMLIGVGMTTPKDHLLGQRRVRVGVHAIRHPEVPREEGNEDGAWGEDLAGPKPKYCGCLCCFDLCNWRLSAITSCRLHTMSQSEKRGCFSHGLFVHDYGGNCCSCTWEYPHRKVLRKVHPWWVAWDMFDLGQE
ncbi:hypothetical protein ACJRO7_017595 [Eucalyptus globulus]|uniref:Uncharacterized protein n=1 Tax=Eucalyptus globulus TaxID=34317 RepID=A0ABD3KQV0_EUCGL